MFTMHSTTLLYHLPFLVRSEPRGPQNKYPHKTFDKLRDSLSDALFCCVYHMTKTSFESLYDILRPRLDAEFLPSGQGGERVHDSSYYMSTKIHLSIALRYFVGGSVYDIMQVHGVDLQSVYDSVWGVVDVINNTPELAFHFPSKDQQQVIAADFCAQSGASFDNVVGAIDGLVISTIMPNCVECEMMNCGQANF
jgi:hypothetical protein